MNKLIAVLITICLSFSCRFQRPPGEGFVSLAPAATEIIYKLGAEDRLKAVSDYCNWPDAVKEKPSVGGLINPSFEKIISLNPEMVFILPGMPGQIKAYLEKNRIKVVEAESSGLEGVYADIEKIARVTGKQKEGELLIAKIKEEIKEIRYRSYDYVKKVYAEISANPAMSPGKKSHINFMIQLAGGENVSGGENRDYVLSGIEYIISKDPDIILILSRDGRQRADYLKEVLRDRTPASEKGNIYYIEDKDAILRPGPRISEGIRQIAGYIQRGNAK